MPYRSLRWFRHSRSGSERPIHRVRFQFHPISPREKFSQAKLESGLSPKGVCNLLGILQGIFSLAVDNDLLLKSPVRNRHKPT